MRQLLTIIIVICLTIHVTGISYALRPRAAIQSERVEFESAMHDKTVELYGIEIKIPEGYYIIHETDKGADILNSKDNFDEQYRYLRGRVVKAKESGQIPLLVTSFHHSSLPFAKAIRDVYGVDFQILSSDYHHDIYLPDEEAQDLSKFDRGTVWRYGIREGIINASDLIIALSMLKGNHYITYEALMEFFSKEEVKEALERIPIESFDSLQRLKQDQNYSSIPYFSQINRLLRVNYFEADVMDLAEMLFVIKTGIVISPRVITTELLRKDTAILFSADSDAHLTAEDWKGMGDILVQYPIAGVHICESPATEELFDPSALSDFLKRISVHHTKTSSAGAEIYEVDVPYIDGKKHKIWLDEGIAKALKTLPVGTSVTLFGRAAMYSVLGEKGFLKDKSVEDFTSDIDLVIRSYPADVGNIYEVVESAFSNYELDIVGKDLLLVSADSRGAGFTARRLFLRVTVLPNRELEVAFDELEGIKAIFGITYDATQIPFLLDDLMNKRLVNTAEGMTTIQAMHGIGLIARDDFLPAPKTKQEIISTLAAQDKYGWIYGSESDEFKALEKLINYNALGNKTAFEIIMEYGLYRGVLKSNLWNWLKYIYSKSESGDDNAREPIEKLLFDSEKINDIILDLFEILIQEATPPSFKPPPVYERDIPALYGKLSADRLSNYKRLMSELGIHRDLGNGKQLDLQVLRGKIEYMVNDLVTKPASRVGIDYLTDYLLNITKSADHESLAFQRLLDELQEASEIYQQIAESEISRTEQGRESYRFISEVLKGLMYEVSGNIKVLDRLRKKHNIEDSDPAFSQGVEEEPKQNLSLLKNEVLDAIENTFGTRYYHFEKACDELLDVLNNPDDYGMTWLPPALQTCRKVKSSFEQIIKHAESSDTEKAKILHIITSASLNDSEMFALLEKLIPIIGNLILDFKNNGELGLATIKALKVAIRKKSKTAIRKTEELMYFFENIFKDTHQETDLRIVAFSIILSCVHDGSEIAVKCLQNLSEALEELLSDPNADDNFKVCIINELNKRYSKEQKYIEHILEELTPYLTKVALTLEIPEKLRNESRLTLSELLVNKNAIAMKAVEEKLQDIESIIVNPKLSNYDKAYYIDALLINMALNGNKAAIPILRKLVPMVRNLILSLSEKNEFWRGNFLDILLKMSFLKIHPATEAIKDIFTNDQVPIGLKEDVLTSLKAKLEMGDQITIYATEQLIPIFEKLATDPQVAKISDGFVKVLEYMGSKGNQDAFLAIERLMPDLERFVIDPQRGEYERGNFLSAIVWCASKSKSAQVSLKRLTPCLETCVTDFGSKPGFNSRILDVLNAESKSGNPAAIQLTRELLVVLHKALSDKNIATLNDLYIGEIIHVLTSLSWKKIDPSGDLVKKSISVVVDIASNEECQEDLREEAARSLMALATELKEADAAKGLVDLLALDKIKWRGFLMNFLHQKMMQGNITAYLLLKNAFMRRGTKKVLPKERASGKVAAAVLDMEQQHTLSVASIFKENMGEDKELEIIINTDRNAKFEDEVEKIIQKNQGKIIVINMSLGTHALSRRDSGKVDGILDVDRVGKWGEQGVIFVIAGGNDNFLSDYSHIILDNVIMVGAAEKVGLNYEKADYSSYGLDLFCITSGSVGLEKGTSLASPRIAGLLVKILRENPNLSIPDALEKIRQFAKPIENSILFKLGMLGAGVIIPEEVDNKKITQIANNTRAVKSSDELQNQHSTTTAIKSSA